MIYNTSERIFDTLFDTQRIYVSKMRTKFVLRKDVLNEGKHPIYIHITGNKKREVIHTGVYCARNDWNEETQRFRPNTKENQDLNLVLDKIQSKLSDIKITYRLSNDTDLTPAIMKDEYLNQLSRTNFVSFMRHHILLDRAELKDGRYKGLLSIHKKLKDYEKNIPFHTMNLEWFSRYRNYLKNKCKNSDVTIATNLLGIKKYLRKAQKSGIKIAFDLNDLKCGDTKGNRNYLTKEELKKCFDFYESQFIRPQSKIILGYFLFSCMTGLRITNVLQLTRDSFQNNQFSITLVKGNKDKTISLNLKAQQIINECEELFVIKYSQKHINEGLKEIMNQLSITKKISFHCARHTFATLFLKSSGRVELLQQLLGHSSIRQTMIYAHIVQEDANKEIFVLDKLF